MMNRVEVVDQEVKVEMTVREVKVIKRGSIIVKVVGDDDVVEATVAAAVEVVMTPS